MLNEQYSNTDEIALDIYIFVTHTDLFVVHKSIFVHTCIRKYTLLFDDHRDDIMKRLKVARKKRVC